MEHHLRGRVPLLRLDRVGARRRRPLVGSAARGLPGGLAPHARHRRRTRRGARLPRLRRRPRRRELRADHLVVVVARFSREVQAAEAAAAAGRGAEPQAPRLETGAAHDPRRLRTAASSRRPTRRGRGDRTDGDAITAVGSTAVGAPPRAGCRGRRPRRPPRGARLRRRAHAPRHDGRGARPRRADRRANARRDPGTAARRGPPPRRARVLGRGWLFDSVPGGAPTAAMLDAAVADVPVYLDANDYHSCWVNTAALAELGITRDTPDPIGGRIGRDADGEPDGMLFETAAQQHVWELLAAQATDAERDAAVERTIAAYLGDGRHGRRRHGVRRARARGVPTARRAPRRTLPIRVVAHWFVANTGDQSANLAQVARAVELAREGDSPWLRVAGVKLVLDGVIDACTAAMRHPYADGSNADPIWPLEALSPSSSPRMPRAAGRDARDRRRGERHRARRARARDRGERRWTGATASSTSSTSTGRMSRGSRGSAWSRRCSPSTPTRRSGRTGPRCSATSAPTAGSRGLRSPTPAACSRSRRTRPPRRTSRCRTRVAATRRSALDLSFSPNHPEYAVPLADAVRHATRDAAYSCREAHAGVSHRVRGGLRGDRSRPVLARRGVSAGRARRPHDRRGRLEYEADVDPDAADTRPTCRRSAVARAHPRGPHGAGRGCTATPVVRDFSIPRDRGGGQVQG